MILVVAGNIEQYRVFCREHGMEDSRDCIYVTERSHLEGRHFDTEVVYVGSYLDNPLYGHPLLQRFTTRSVDTIERWLYPEQPTPEPIVHVENTPDVGRAGTLDWTTTAGINSTPTFVAVDWNEPRAISQPDRPREKFQETTKDLKLYNKLKGVLK